MRRGTARHHSRLKFQRIFIKKKIINTNSSYPVLIPCNRTFFPKYDYLFERIIDLQQRSSLLLHFFLRFHPIRRLNVISSATKIANKIHFQRRSFPLSLLSSHYLAKKLTLLNTYHVSLYP